MLAVYGQRNSLVFFYNESKILTILFIVKYEKITLFDEFLLLLGPIISRFLHVQTRKKINNTTKGAFSSPISMVWLHRPRPPHYLSVIKLNEFNDI